MSEPLKIALTVLSGIIVFVIGLYWSWPRSISAVGVPMISVRASEGPI